MNKKNALIILYLFFSTAVYAYKGEVAITIDDLPFVGTAGRNETKLQKEADRFNAIKQALIAHKVPATGFIIAGTIERGQWELLESFKNAGFSLGNHAFSHNNLAVLSASKYIHDIDRADKRLNEIMTTPKFFRYPYLAEATGKKKKQVQEYLASHAYIVAPVTIDSKDFHFNKLIFSIPFKAREKGIEAIKARYLKYVWKQTLMAESIAKRRNTANKQVLLIHANLLNSHCLNELIEMYKKNDYHFISLEEAMNR